MLNDYSFIFYYDPFLLFFSCKNITPYFVGYTTIIWAKIANFNLLKERIIYLVNLHYGVDVKTNKGDNTPYQNSIQPLY